MTAKEAQSILELETPFTVVELKSAHKNALVAWFPAQFMSDRAQLSKALERTAQIHEAYDVLLAQCEAEKAAGPNPFVEEAMKQAYGQTPSPPSPTKSLPAPEPALESRIPAALEPLPRAETAPTFLQPLSEVAPAASRPDDVQPEGNVLASTASPEPAVPEPSPVRAVNPFLHEIVPLKVVTEAPKVELRGRVATPLEPPVSPEANTGAGSALAPRTDSAITKLRPPKVVISPRLRGATVQPAMPVVTVPVPVPLPPLSAPAPAGALSAPPLVEEESVKAEPAAPEPAVQEVAPEVPAPSGEQESKASAPPAEPAPSLGPVTPVLAEAPAAAPMPRVPMTLPAPILVAEKAAEPAAMPDLQAAEPVAAPVSEQAPSPVDEAGAPVQETSAPPAPPARIASPAPASSEVQPLVSEKAAAPAAPVHGVPATVAEEVSAVEQASHHAPASPVAVPSATAATHHAANHAPAPIARPQAPSPPHGKARVNTTEGETEVEADDPPAGDHALVPALGDRYHPAEKEASPNTDTTRHFPTRPFAPSSGSVPIHEDGKSSVASEARPSGSEEPAAGQGTRPLSAGQRVLRFFLAVLCVGGVGYGIYLLSQTDLGRDPWGKKPGSGGPIDRLNHQVLENLKRDAEDGIARAQYDLAKVYQNGKGVPENAEEALKWFRKAAEQGHMDAQYAVGDAYKNGRGVPQDNAEALKWYRMAESTREEQRGETKEKGKEEEEDLRLQ